MSVTSKTRTEKRPKPQCRETAQPGPYVYFIPHKGIPMPPTHKRLTPGAFGRQGKPAAEQAKTA